MSGSIVIGFDGSEIARATLGYVARRTPPGDRLVVAHVLAIPVAMLESPYFDRALERSRELGQHVLDEAKGALPPDAHADMRIVEGPPARALVDLAREIGADEIAVGSRGFGSFRAAALGSTSHALLHETDRPVLSCRAAPWSAHSAWPRAPPRGLSRRPCSWATTALTTPMLHSTTPPSEPRLPEATC